MADRYLCEIKITRIQYAGDRDRDTVVTSTAVERPEPQLALDRAHVVATEMLSHRYSTDGES